MASLSLHRFMLDIWFPLWKESIDLKGFTGSVVHTIVIERLRGQRMRSWNIRQRLFPLFSPTSTLCSPQFLEQNMLFPACTLVPRSDFPGWNVPFISIHLNPYPSSGLAPWACYPKLINKNERASAFVQMRRLLKWPFTGDRDDQLLRFYAIFSYYIEYYIYPVTQLTTKWVVDKY